MTFWQSGKHRLDVEPDLKLDHDALLRRTNAVFQLLGDVYGRDKLVLKAGKLEALDLMQGDLPARVLGLKRLVFEDPTLEEKPDIQDVPGILDEVEDIVADFLARRDVEDRLEQRIAEKMQERHEEFVQELKMQVLKENGGPDNAQTLRKFAELEKLEERKLANSILTSLRPRSVLEVVGQQTARKALFSKIASPYPQHMLLYGPPGVGKTTVARLALEYAKTLPGTPFDEDAKFIEVDGTTLRWDPREVTNPLLGSVHDPIYQGARRDLAESSIPEPKPGLVTDAHGGILFIDEIGEMDPLLQNKLLKVLEDKRVTFDSSYYDPDDENVPKYIKKLFEEGAPADFILIGATTRDPEDINPALRSRCTEVFFDPLDHDDIVTIVKQAAERINVQIESDVPHIISEYTVEGRRATSMLADAYGLALHERQVGVEKDEKDQDEGAKDRPVTITPEHIYEVARMARISPAVEIVASPSKEVGRVFGLGVSGFLGSVIEIEAVAFPADEPGKGVLRFNETAGSMAKDSVFNAASVVRKVTNKKLSDWDVHVNIVGGGLIDGPSAGAAIVLAIISALEERPVRQDVAMTGEISIQGRIKPVGGVYEKLYGARRAGISYVLVPEKNKRELPWQVQGIEPLAVSTIEEAMEIAFADDVSEYLKRAETGANESNTGLDQRPPYRTPVPGSA